MPIGPVYDQLFAESFSKERRKMLQNAVAVASEKTTSKRPNYLSSFYNL